MADVLTSGQSGAWHVYVRLRLRLQIYTRVSIKALKQVHDATHPAARIEPRRDRSLSIDLDLDDADEDSGDGDG